MHHIIPAYWTYFGEELFAQRHGPYYQVSLTIECHACQHDNLYKVFSDIHDGNALRLLYAQAEMSPEARQRQAKGQVNGGLKGGKSAVQTGQLAEVRGKAYKATSKPIILTNIKTSEETQYPSLHAAARAIGGSAAGLCRILRGDRRIPQRTHCSYCVG